MNKKLNTVLFMLAVTVYNLIVMIAIIILLLFIVLRLLPEDAESLVTLGAFVVVFIAGIVGSFFIYHRTIRFISKKVDMEKYFHPLFTRNK